MNKQLLSQDVFPVAIPDGLSPKRASQFFIHEQEPSPYGAHDPPYIEPVGAKMEDHRISQGKMFFDDFHHNYPKRGWQQPQFMTPLQPTYSFPQPMMPFMNPHNVDFFEQQYTFQPPDIGYSPWQFNQQYKKFWW